MTYKGKRTALKSEIFRVGLHETRLFQIEEFSVEGDKPPATRLEDDKKTNAHKTSITDENIVRK